MWDNKDSSEDITVLELLEFADEVGAGWRYSFEASNDEDELVYALDEKTIDYIYKEYPDTKRYNSFLYKETASSRIDVLWGMIAHDHEDDAIVNRIF